MSSFPQNCYIWVTKTVLCPAGVWPKVSEMMENMRPETEFKESVAKGINELMEANVLNVTGSGPESKRRRDILVTNIKEKMQVNQPLVGAVSFDIKSLVELRLQTLRLTVTSSARQQDGKVKGAVGCFVGPKKAVDDKVKERYPSGVEEWKCLELSKSLGVWIAMIKQHKNVVKVTAEYQFEEGDELLVRCNRCRFREPYLVVSTAVAPRLDNVRIDKKLKAGDEYMLVPAVSMPGPFIPQDITLDELLLWGDISQDQAEEMKNFLDCPSDNRLPCQNHSMQGGLKKYDKAQVNGAKSDRDKIQQGFSPTEGDIHGALPQEVDETNLNLGSLTEGRRDLCLVVHTEKPLCEAGIPDPTLVELENEERHKRFWFESPVVACTVFESGTSYYFILPETQEGGEPSEKIKLKSTPTQIDDLSPRKVQVSSDWTAGVMGDRGPPVGIDPNNMEYLARMAGMYPPYMTWDPAYGYSQEMWPHRATMNPAPWHGMSMDQMSHETARVKRNRPQSRSRSAAGGFMQGHAMTHNSSCSPPQQEMYPQLDFTESDEKELENPKTDRSKKMEIIQRKCADTNVDKEGLFNTVKGRAVELAKQTKGSLLVSHLFEISKEEQQDELVQSIRASVKELSMHPEGTYVVQRAIEIVPARLKESLIDTLKENPNALMEVIQDKHGIYMMRSCVLQSCKQAEDDKPQMPLDFIKFILKAVESKLSDMVSKKPAFKFSYKLVIWLIECCRYEPDLERVKGILTYAADHAQQLINQEFGNILLAKVLEYGREDHQKSIFKVARSVLKNDTALRRHWWAGHVVDKCAELLAANDLNQTLQDERKLFMDAVKGGGETGECALQRLLKNHSGRYTAKRIFKLGTDAEKEEMRGCASEVELAPDPKSVPFKSSLLSREEA